MSYTEKDVAKAALKVIDKRGDDFVYIPERDGQCAYSEDGGVTGSCIFGAALIEELGFEYSFDWEGSSIYSLLEDKTLVGDKLDVTAWLNVETLSTVQVRQDGGDTYGLLRDYLEVVANS